MGCAPPGDPDPNPGPGPYPTPLPPAVTLTLTVTQALTVSLTLIRVLALHQDPEQEVPRTGPLSSRLALQTRAAALAFAEQLVAGQYK